MSIIQALVLGIVQGLTEFIPISSSGHLIIVPKIFGWSEHSTAFDVILHLGTLFSLLFYFRKTLSKGIKETFSNIKTPRKRSENFKLLVKIGAAIIPTLLIGFLLQKFIDTNFKGINVITITTILVGILLILADTVFKANKNTLAELKPPSFLLIGLFQSLAFIRGTSRSGITIIGGLTQKLTRKEAARLSFLLSIPIVATTAIYEIIKLIKEGGGQENFIALTTGFFFSAVSGFFAIKFLMNFLEKHGLAIFGIYRIILGVILVLLF